LAIDSDNSISLPTPPPPRPAARREAVEAALRKFDGEEVAPGRREQAKPTWWRSHQRQLGALATAAVIVVVSIPVALTVLRDQPKPAATQPAADALEVVPPPVPAPSQTDEPQPSQDQMAAAGEPRSRLSLETKRESPSLSLVPDEKVANEAPAPTIATVPAAPPPPPPPPPPVPAPAPAKSQQYSQDAGAEEMVVTGSRVARPNLGKSSNVAVMAERSAPGKAADTDAPGRFLTRLQAAVRADDRSAIAGMIAYPLRVNFDDGLKTYKDRPSIQRDFERIFTPRVRQAILDQEADKLFANYQGSMIGDGEVWFDRSCSNASCSDREPLRIKAINP